MNEGILSIPPPVIRATFGDIVDVIASIEYRAVDWCCLMREGCLKAYKVLFKRGLMSFPAQSTLHYREMYITVEFGQDRLR